MHSIQCTLRGNDISVGFYICFATFLVYYQVTSSSIFCLFSEYYREDRKLGMFDEANLCDTGKQQDKVYRELVTSTKTCVLRSVRESDK